MSQDNLIYALHCPHTKKPVYVGQSKKGMDRPFDHIKEKSHSDKINQWMKTLRNEGKEPILVILEQNFSEDLLSPKEQFWISHFLNKGNLLLNQHGISPLIFETTKFSIIDEDDPLYDIRNYIRAKRKILKLSQTEFAQRAGVGLRALRELEQGCKTNFNTDVIIKLLRLVGNGKLSVKMDDK